MGIVAGNARCFLSEAMTADMSAGCPTPRPRRDRLHGSQGLRPLGEPQGARAVHGLLRGPQTAAQGRRWNQKDVIEGVAES